MDILSITTQGIVVDDAKLLASRDGKEYLRFKLACHRYGETNEETYFFTVFVFEEKLISTIKKCITKGRHLTVIGSFSDEIWYKNDGKPSISRIIKANEIYYEKFHFKKNNDNNKSSKNGKETKNG